MFELLQFLLSKVTSMEFDEVINILLTSIIAISVFFQAKFSKLQARTLLRSEKRHRQQNNPKIKLVTILHTIQDSTNSDIHTNFVGIGITNTSLLDVTITSVDFELGIPENSVGNIFLAHLISPTIKYKGYDLSDANLPQRLKYGETIKLLYEEDRIISELKSREGDQPLRVRPRCLDSLGNFHTLRGWVTWGEKGRISTFNGPGPGLVTYEEWMANFSSKKHSWIVRIKKCFGK